MLIQNYFDPQRHEVEKERMFGNGMLEYIGHSAMVPVQGNYFVNPDARWVLTNDGRDVRILSNVCAHQQARLLNQNIIQNRNFNPPISEYLPGTLLTQIVCPIHSWTYNVDGNLHSTPVYTDYKACLAVPKHEWNGFLFTGKGDLPETGIAELDSTEYFFHKRYLTGDNCNWKTFIEVYCDLYHVKSAHSGLSWLVDVDKVEFKFGDQWSAQFLPSNDWTKYPRSEVYLNYREKLLDVYNVARPKYGAIFFLLYPNVMIEVYPGTLVVSVAYPDGPNKTVNVIDFYYTSDAIFDAEFVQMQQRAYFETAREDSQLCLTTDLGRWSMYVRKESTEGILTPQEALVSQFHTFIRSKMDPTYIVPS